MLAIRCTSTSIFIIFDCDATPRSVLPQTATVGFFAMVDITMTSTNSTDSALLFRLAEEMDRDFIHEMHRQTETWGDGSREVGETFEEDDHHYVGKWTPDQGGVIAEEAGERIGAAWLRNFTAEDPGTGYVADEYPELAIAMAPGNTGKGLGQKLMLAMLEQAKDNGKPGVSLCVAEGNERARKLYEKLGFDHHGTTESGGGTYAVMLYTF